MCLWRCSASHGTQRRCVRASRDAEVLSPVAEVIVQNHSCVASVSVNALAIAIAIAAGAGAANSLSSSTSNSDSDHSTNSTTNSSSNLVPSQAYVTSIQQHQPHCTAAAIPSKYLGVVLAGPVGQWLSSRRFTAAAQGVGMQWKCVGVWASGARLELTPSLLHSPDLHRAHHRLDGACATFPALGGTLHPSYSSW